MFGIEKDFQQLMEQAYGPLGEKQQMTEIEEVKAQIKVLEKKVSFLEERVQRLSQQNQE
jgi:ubiquinone biosynthesis protein UbiJ